MIATNKIKGRKPLLLKYKGQVRPVLEWAAMYGINPWTLKQRIKYDWPEDELFTPARNVRTSEQKAQDNITLNIAKLRKVQEEIPHKNKVNTAIVKVLKMRESRSLRADVYVDYQESIHYAIARVLEM